MTMFKFFFISLSIFVFASCDFNINDSPGPQMSYSIEESKSHGTFICEYKIPGDNINGVTIETIFAEKQFWREQGVFLKKDIDCCKSQLVIVSKDLMDSDNTTYDKTWTVLGFESISSYVIYKNYNSLILPDSIPIDVMAIEGKDTSKLIKKITLYKVKTN